MTPPATVEHEKFINAPHFRWNDRRTASPSLDMVSHRGTGHERLWPFPGRTVKDAPLSIRYEAGQSEKQCISRQTQPSPGALARQGVATMGKGRVMAQFKGLILARVVPLQRRTGHVRNLTDYLAETIAKLGKKTETMARKNGTQREQIENLDR